MDLDEQSRKRAILPTQECGFQRRHELPLSVIDFA